MGAAWERHAVCESAFRNLHMASNGSELLFRYFVYQEALCCTTVSLEMVKKTWYCNFNGGLHWTQRSEPPAAWTPCGRGQVIVLRCLLFFSELAQYRCSVKRIFLLDCPLDTFVTEKRPNCETVVWWEMGHGSVGDCGYQNSSYWTQCEPQEENVIIQYKPTKCTIYKLIF